MKSSGLTLIEMIVAIVLFGIIAFTSTALLTQGFTAYFAIRDMSDADWQGRIALERMTRDLREIQSVNDILTASTNQFIYRDNQGNTVDYHVAAATLLRNSQPLADRIKALNFTYRDRNGVITSTVSGIRYITITVTIMQDSGSFTETITVVPRNFSSYIPILLPVTTSYVLPFFPSSAQQELMIKKFIR